MWFLVHQCYAQKLTERGLNLKNVVESFNRARSNLIQKSFFDLLELTMIVAFSCEDNSA